MKLSSLRRMPLLGGAFLAAAVTSLAQPISFGQNLKLEGIIPLLWLCT